MSRTKKKTPKVKKKTWSPAYAQLNNERRKAKYAKNEEYREQLKQKAREAYREKTGVEGRDCRDSLLQLKSIGRIRYVKKDRNTHVKRLTFTRTELAAALGYTLIAIYRWQKDGRLPKAEIKLTYADGQNNTTDAPGNIEAVYLDTEVIGIIKVLGEHQESVSQYRVTHTETTARIFAAVKKARKDFKAK